MSVNYYKLRLPSESYLIKLENIAFFLWFFGLAFVKWEPGAFDFLFILIIIICLRRGYFKRTSKTVLIGGILLFIFLLGNVISVFNIVAIERSVWYFFVTVYMFFIWYCIVKLCTVTTNTVKRLLFWGYLSGAIVSIMVGILAYFNIIHIDSVLKYGRVCGFYKDPNVFGAYLIPAAVICSINAFTLNRNNITWLIIALITLLGVVLSFSRGAWVNLCITFCILAVILFLLNLNKIWIIRRQTLYSTISIVLCLGVCCAILFSQDSVSYMITNRLGLMGYDYDRFNAHATAIQVFSQNLNGIGPGQTEVVLPMSTHNNYLKILNETGWLGFLGLMFFYGATCFRTLRLSFDSRGIYRIYFAVLLALIIGQLVNSLVIDSLHWRHFWILLALPWIEKTTAVNKNYAANRSKQR